MRAGQARIIEGSVAKNKSLNQAAENVFTDAAEQQSKQLESDYAYLNGTVKQLILMEADETKDPK